jgi:hypothetical protein
MHKNSFLGVYIAAVTARERGLRRLVDKLSYDGVVLVSDVVRMSGRTFWKKYPASEKVKHTFRKVLKQMGLRLGMQLPT